MWLIVLGLCASESVSTSTTDPLEICLQNDLVGVSNSSLCMVSSVMDAYVNIIACKLLLHVITFSYYSTVQEIQLMNIC